MEAHHHNLKGDIWWFKRIEIIRMCSRVQKRKLRFNNFIFKSIFLSVVFNRIRKIGTYVLLPHPNKISLKNMPFHKKYYGTFRYRLYWITNISKNKKSFTHIKILPSHSYACMLLQGSGDWRFYTTECRRDCQLGL